ncbi:MAG: arylsulfatase [Burkholderiales bacterium]|nr:arylsulfatase [Burkholderiales bacterium]
MAGSKKRSGADGGGARKTMRGFHGRIGKTLADSTPWWPPQPAAPAGAPNIVLMFLDDMGFSDLGAFGSEIETPHIDRLAREGLRFGNYTTVPMCTPARAALLTGRNPHSVGCGWLTHGDPGYPGYGGEISPDAPTMAELLQRNGYSTMCIGKWHNTKEHDAGAAGDKSSWPTRRGFDKFYGFIASETSYFYPDCLYEGTQTLDIDAYPPGYFATDDWTDRAIRWTKEHLGGNPAKPFFLYLAYNAPHMPLQARPEDLQKYRGRYDAGWDACREQRLRRQVELGLMPPATRLPPPNPGVQSWPDLPADKKELYARYMEVYAALIDNLDGNIGRLTAFLEQVGQLDNTLIILASDNGASAMGGDEGAVNGWQRRLGGADSDAKIRALAEGGGFGGPETYIAYPLGWAQVSNTPFRNFKRTPVNGGIRVPLIVRYPGRVTDPGAIRRQWVHVTDMLPTVMEVAGIARPEESGGRKAPPFDGSSFAAMLGDPGAPERRTAQHYELDGNRGYIRDGWKIVSLQPPDKAIDLDNWMLFNLEKDPTEIENLAKVFPDRVRDLAASFDAEAFGNNVYPIDNRGYDKSMSVPPYRLPLINMPHVFYPGAQTAERVSVSQLFADRCFRMIARFHYREGDRGVIYSLGGIFGGVLLYVMDGGLHFVYQRWPEPQELNALPLQPGPQEAVFEFRALGSRKGSGRLLLNGAEMVPETPMSPTIGRLPSEGLDVGIDRRQPASSRYAVQGGFRYTGEIEWVRVEPGAQAPGSSINRPEPEAQALACVQAPASRKE